MPTDETEARVLTEDEEARLLLKATAEECALVICALDTLQRLSTVAAFQRGEDKGNHLVVLRPKGRGKTVPYRVPISSRLRRALDALRQQGPYYFSSVQRFVADGKEDVDGRRNEVIRLFQALCQRAGVEYGRENGGITFHCLRHTGASRMLNRGVDIRTVAEIGNWRDWRVLRRYLHPIGDAEQRAVEVVGARVVHVLARTNKKPQRKRASAR